MVLFKVVQMWSICAIVRFAANLGVSVLKKAILIKDGWAQIETIGDA